VNGPLEASDGRVTVAAGENDEVLEKNKQEKGKVKR
jgi:hypothetical protein